MKLICFPHAGGFSNYYHFLKNAVYKNVDEVYIYEYPGRNTRSKEKEATDFKECVVMAAEYVTTKVTEGEEFAFFGHSMGAFVAYEAALLLSRKWHYIPKVVFVSGQRAPCTVKQDDYTDNPEIAYPYLKSLGGIAKIFDSNPAVRDYFLPFINKDLRLLKTYIPDMAEDNNKLPDCVVLHSDNDPELKGYDLQLWGKCFKTIKNIYEFHGNHFYLDNYHERIIEIIDNELKESQ